MSGWTDAFDRVMRDLSAENASLNPQRVRDISSIIEGVQSLQEDHIRDQQAIEALRFEVRDLEKRLRAAGFDV